MTVSLDRDKFAKVLALAESDHPGEALSALRAARVMLTRAGLNFRDLAAPAKQTDPFPVQPAQAPAEAVPATAADRRIIHEMETKLRLLERTVERQQGELDRQRLEADRWRRLAQETADRLWDLGKALDSKAPRPGPHDRRRALIDHLRDPHTAQFSDRELARRLGVPVSAVTHWRRRLLVLERARRMARVDRRARRCRLHGGIWMRSPAPGGS